MKTEEDWNEIYSCTGELDSRYENLLKQNMDSYEKILENVWGDLDACVNHAIKNGNHAAFVKYYINKAYDQYGLFEKVMLDSFFKRNVNVKEYVKWVIMKNEYWKAPNIDFKVDNYVICSKSTLYSWLNGNNGRLPRKYEVVQICFYLNMSYKEANRLLGASGNEMLYILDDVDAICMFYLDYFYKKENRNIPVLKKLEKVKNMINSEARINDADLYAVKKVGAALKAQINEPKEKLSRYPFGWNFDERISLLKEELRAIDGILLPKQEDSPFYLTICYQKKFEECEQEEDFECFIRNYDFGILHYGYTAQTGKFINSRRYKKNLYVPSIELKADIRSGELDNFLEQKDIQFYNDYFEREYWKDSISEENKKNTITILNKIWMIRWLKSDCDKVEFEGSGNLTKVEDMVNGRNVFKVDKSRYRVDLSDTFNAYKFSVNNKENLIKFCIACGREDDLGMYLRLANYWDRDYFINDISLEPIEKRDAFIIYAIKYRDALINAWSQIIKRESPERNLIEFKKKVKDNFPFLQLALTINRDIEFVAAQAIHRSDDFKRLMRSLIYPVIYKDGESSKTWCKEFEKRSE